ncbi:hypothetical protein [Amycolatopsis sp. cmx-4-83]|uniref:hypothetical protein n=1 Tax=Amycolatopsis sp. cmx-4-83 TaxID=2790940 RepID=UPI00397B1337
MIEPLTTGTMEALVGKHGIEKYHVEQPIHTAAVSIDQCSSQPEPDYAPGFISVSCGAIATATYADWLQPSKGSRPLGSDPAQTYGLGGTTSHGFVYQEPAATGRGRLIEVGSLGNRDDDALMHALGGAYRTTNS